MTPKIFSAFFLCLLLHLFNPSAFAQETQEQHVQEEDHSERILSFHTDLKIDSSGLMHVSEKIKIYAAGNRIKRGLVRTIPTFRKDASGKKRDIDFKITSILKDGRKENFKTKNDRESRAIYIGREDFILSPGFYEYEINYETRGHVGFFKDYDEIYWNVTGSMWAFQIENASATIKFPPGALPGKTSCYTGRPGSKARDCNVTSNPDHTVTFKTNEVLNSGSGFTVAVAFTKGIIEPPSFLENLRRDYLKLVLTLVLLSALGGYYYFSWTRFGRSLKKAVVVPSFNVPNEWSPAVLRYFYKQRIDEKSFAISVINMAVKKVVKISKGIGKKEDYAVEQASGLTATLAKEEAVIYARWLNKKKRIYINKANGRTINSAKNAHEKILKAQLNLKEFSMNHRKPLLNSILVTAGIFILYMIFIDPRAPVVMLAIVPFISLGIFLVVRGISSFRQSTAWSIFIIIFGCGFGGSPLVMVILYLQNIPLHATIFIVASTILFLLYLHSIKGPNPAGAVIVNKIKGFKMYLKTAEEHRLNMLNPPEHSPELFERLLPYAIALGVENAWGKKFEDILSKIDYQPDWYNGDNFSYTSFSYVFIQPFNSAVSDSAPVSSSSSDSSGWDSGSSDSGSSDGGGGGGGGDGW